MEFASVRRKSDSGMEVVSLTFIATSMHVGTIWKNSFEQFALRGLPILIKR